MVEQRRLSPGGVGTVTSKAEFLIVHLLLVFGVVAMTWGPLVYLLDTMAMHNVTGVL